MRPLILAIVFLLAGVAHAATTYWTTPALLKHFFKASERVRAVEILGSELTEQTGMNAPKGKYLVYIGQTGDRIDGFAVVDEEKGQHMPITFGFLFGTDGRIKDTQVMTYREPYGDEIRDRRFLDQLVGKTLADALKPGVDVDGVTGATISVKSTTIAARRALALCDIAKRKVVSGGQG